MNEKMRLLIAYDGSASSKLVGFILFEIMDMDGNWIDKVLFMRVA